MNLGTFVVLLAVLAMVALAARSVLKDRGGCACCSFGPDAKTQGAGCCGGCSGCCSGCPAAKSGGQGASVAPHQ